MNVWSWDFTSSKWYVVCLGIVDEAKPNFKILHFFGKGIKINDLWTSRVRMCFATIFSRPWFFYCWFAWKNGFLKRLDGGCLCGFFPSWRFFVTSFWMVKWPFQRISGFHLGDKKGHGLNDLVGVFFRIGFSSLSRFFVAKMPRSWCGRYQRTHGKRSSFWEHFTAIFGPRWCGSRPMKWEEMWFENSGGQVIQAATFLPLGWVGHVFTSKRGQVSTIPKRSPTE